MGEAAHKYSKLGMHGDTSMKTLELKVEESRARSPRMSVEREANSGSFSPGPLQDVVINIHTDQANQADERTGTQP